MLPPFSELAFLAAGTYLAGAIPFGWLLAKIVKGIDLRQVGSGNIGATNAGRAIGKWAAFVVYLLDFAKGYLPVRFGLTLLSTQPADATLIQTILGALAVVGHCFPVYLKFRGGKGVATTTGVMLALAPMAMALAGAVWFVVFVLSRYVSVASLLLALSLPFLVWVEFPQECLRSKLPVLLLAGAIALFIVWTHRANIRRLMEGTEPRMIKTNPPQEKSNS